MQPQAPIAVTLPAAEWDRVMLLLAEAPYRVAAPLIHAIQQQCLAADIGERDGAEPKAANGAGAAPL